MKRMVAVAHFPPPVHGMAVAVDSLVSELERVLLVRRVTITAPTLYRAGGRYHLIRAGRVVRAVGVLLCERRRAGQAFFSCDAGTGMAYTLLLVAAARVLRYRFLLQHHSYAYLSRRSRVLAAIVRLGGRRCVHLVTAPRMQADLLAAYPNAATRVVGIARDLPLMDAVVGPVPGERLIVGFLGNVTVEKGIGLALDTVRAATRAGVPIELRVAGPADTTATTLLDAAVAAGDPVIVVGPVYGAERNRYLDGIDAFLFPSLYPHESFGLAAWEAMARGRPVLAYRSGCLTAEAVGEGGLVVERDDDFVAHAIPLLAAWRDDVRALTDAGRRAHTVASAAVTTSREQVKRLCADLADGPMVRRTPVPSPGAEGDG